MCVRVSVCASVYLGLSLCVLLCVSVYACVSTVGVRHEHYHMRLSVCMYVSVVIISIIIMCVCLSACLNGFGNLQNVHFNWPELYTSIGLNGFDFCLRLLVLILFDSLLGFAHIGKLHNGLKLSLCLKT